MVTIKTKEEIEILKEGGKNLAFILEELKKFVAPGVSTIVFEEEAQKLLKELGDKASFLGYKPAGARRKYPASVCVSINEEVVHGIPNEEQKILKEGDVVTLDMGVIHKGLFVDGAITVGVGKISAEAERMLKATEESLMAGIKMAREGNTIGDIGHAIEAVSEAYKLSQADDLCGHGVGYAVHEEPYVPNFGKPGTGMKLKAGMVLAIEPMLTLGGSAVKLMPDGYTYSTKDGSLSAHFEHTVVITSGDPIIVTK